MNQDGATTGMTAPNPASQRKAIETAFRDAGIKPGDIGYVEAHGTGTPVGDPIEMHAVTNVLRNAPADHRCWVGSAKANVGHLEAAAGMVGLVKAVLAV